MEVKFFGKSAEIRVETVVIIIAALVMLGCLVGYIFFRDVGDIIIEAGQSGPQTTTGGVNTDKAGFVADRSHTGNETHISEKTDRENGASEGDEAENSSVKKEQIKIYVVGCVNKPGIVTIEKGQLIDDAIKLAGGLTEDADAGSINMVYSLKENAMLYIKSRQDTEKESQGKGAEIITGTGNGAVLIVGTDNTDTGNNGKNAKVNINTADVDELDTLPGIGEATAKDIIAYREKNGPFTKIEDIMNVPRIKQNRFESIKDFITVE